MRYIRNSYFGWAEEWFDNGDPRVDEVFIRFFVNRYFDLPEDWDDDDVPLTMIWVRCITCGFVHEHFIRELDEEWENLLDNWDNTYTLLSDPECESCKSPEYGRDYIQKERLEMIKDEYKSEFSYKREEEEIQFESEIEKNFWKVWRVTFPDIALIPQYPIRNYRVDFAHIPTKTVIELDGKSFHSAPHQIANDEIRQANIEREGWRFLRFKGSDIHYHVDKCVLETALFLSKVDKMLINEVEFVWRSSPSARLSMRLRRKYNLGFDVPLSDDIISC